MPPAALDHPRWRRRLHQGPQVHVERPVDLLVGEILDHPARRQRGVGDQRVHGARPVGQSQRSAGIREVRRQHLGATAELRPDLLERVIAPAVQQHPRAACIERTRDAPQSPTRR